VHVDETGTASVEAVKAPPVPGVQKPPRRVGKRFRDRHVAAPEKKVKRLAGLKTRPAWLRQDQPGREPGSLPWRCGNQLVLRPDGEGVGAMAQNRVGAIVERLKGWNQAIPTDPDKGGDAWTKRPSSLRPQ
jgi:hypothetical protein